MHALRAFFSAVRAQRAQSLFKRGLVASVKLELAHMDDVTRAGLRTECLELARLIDQENSWRAVAQTSDTGSVPLSPSARRPLHDTLDAPAVPEPERGSGRLTTGERAVVCDNRAFGRTE